MTNGNDALKNLSKNTNKKNYNSPKKPSNNKNKLVYSIIGVVVVIGLIIGGVFVWKRYDTPEVLVADDETTESVEEINADNETTESGEGIDEEITIDETIDEKTVNEILAESKAPVKTEKWTKIPFAEQEKNEDFKDDVINSAQTTTIVNASNLMPSTENGYTDNPDNAVNKDGSLNLNYSYQTKENIEYNVNLYLQRLLNPVFGQWNTIPIGQPNGVEGAFPEEIFIDMFAPEWWNANIQSNNHSKLPVYLDWNNDNYGGLTFSPGPAAFYGQIKSMSTNVEPTSDEVGVNIIVKADVEFVANLENEKKEVRTGVLTLKLGPNRESKDINRRNIIEDASLVMN